MLHVSIILKSFTFFEVLDHLDAMAVSWLMSTPYNDFDSHLADKRLLRSWSPTSRFLLPSLVSAPDEQEATPLISLLLSFVRPPSPPGCLICALIWCKRRWMKDAIKRLRQMAWELSLYLPSGTGESCTYDVRVEVWYGSIRGDTYLRDLPASHHKAAP